MRADTASCKPFYIRRSLPQAGAGQANELYHRDPSIVINCLRSGAGDGRNLVRWLLNMTANLSRSHDDGVKSVDTTICQGESEPLHGA